MKEIRAAPDPAKPLEGLTNAKHNRVISSIYRKLMK